MVVCGTQSLGFLNKYKTTTSFMLAVVFYAETISDSSVFDFIISL